MSTTTTTIKFEYDGTLRRIQVKDAEMSYHFLKLKIQDLFPELVSFSLSYLDEDNENISIISDDDIQEASRVAREFKNGILRIKIVSSQQTSKTSAQSNQQQKTASSVPPSSQQNPKPNPTAQFADQFAQLAGILGQNAQGSAQGSAQMFTNNPQSGGQTPQPLDLGSLMTQFGPLIGQVMNSILTPPPNNSNNCNSSGNFNFNSSNQSTGNTSGNPPPFNPFMFSSAFSPQSWTPPQQQTQTPQPQTQTPQPQTQTPQPQPQSQTQTPQPQTPAQPQGQPQTPVQPQGQPQTPQTQTPASQSQTPVQGESSSTPPPQTKTDFKFKLELEELESMGFSDREANIRILEQHQGVLEEALTELLRDLPPE